MKKILILACLLFTFSIVGCDEDSPFFNQNVNNTTEEKIKTSDTMRINDVTISANYKSCYITPNGFDYEKLEKKNYSRMTITFSYYVTYSKTWSSLDFLYDGAPKYDVTIKDTNNMGVQKEGLTTTKTSTYNSISVTYSLADIKYNQLILEIGSTNIQNDVIFTNLAVTYKCR